MPNDNQPAKSYIETAMAEIGWCSKCGYIGPCAWFNPRQWGLHGDKCNYGAVKIPNAQTQTLAKIALRAIAALEKIGASFDTGGITLDRWAREALADINALAAKGSQ